MNDNIVEIKILNLLKDSKKPLSIIEIKDSTDLDFNEIYTIMKKLVFEGKIRITKKEKYELTNLKFGNVRINEKGYGFLDILGEKSLYIPKAYLNGVVDGDYASVAIIDEEKREGKIRKIISHEKEQFVGEIFVKDNQYYARLDDKNKKNIVIKVKNINLPIISGSKVKLTLGELINGKVYDGEVKSIICHVNDPGSDILSKAEEFDICTNFSEEALEEANSMPRSVSNYEIKDRKDFRNKTIFTIDGDDSKDFDDAVSIEILDNGNYLLGVHIADVAYYIKKGSVLDKEAYCRGLSSYLANTVIPMLPHILSNGICSLNPGVDRLTKTCQIEFDKNGEILNYDVFDSVINSKKRMTYNKVSEVLNGSVKDNSYYPFVEDLKQMKNLSDAIRLRRNKNGCINFDTSEIKIIMNDNGKVLDVIKEKRIESEKIIEDFMISANICVAQYFNYMDLPSIYRIHEKPKEENIEKFFEFLKLTKERVGKLPKTVTPKLISDILINLKESPNFEIYSSLLLKSMKKAKYSPINLGHFGLSEKEYLHFTSPIRRYSDLIVHRLINDIKKSINNNKVYKGEDFDNLNRISNHVSNKEDKIDKCEREVNKMKSAEYMQDKIGCVYKGKIVSVSQKGMFIDIYNGVEGLLKFPDMSNNYNEYSVCYNGVKYSIGDIVDVKVNSANKITGYIDLKFKNNTKKLIREKHI